MVDTVSLLIAFPHSDPAPCAGYTRLASGNASNFALAGTGSGQTRQSFAFDTTTTPGSVLLNVTGNSGNLVWVGDGSTNAWDLNQTANWKNGATPDKYLDLDRVTFDDTGSNNPDVLLFQAFSPGSITVNNSSTLRLQGGTTTINVDSRIDTLSVPPA